MLLKKSLRKVARRIVAMGTDEYNEHVHHFSRCIDFLAENGIEGDVLEFGGGGGETLLILERTVARSWPQMRHATPRLFGFDSFEGLPEPKGKDRDFHTDPVEAGVKFNRGAYKHSKEEISRKLRRAANNPDSIHLVEGWYENVLIPRLRDELAIRGASLINVDCDFYHSTATVLNWCEPIVRQGTIISFDDWFCYRASPFHGEQLAFREFLARNTSLTATEFSSYSWHGKAFIINRSDQ